MPQDNVTGAAANEWGRETARRIAREIGATMNDPTSNESILNGKRIVIKCASQKNNSVGVTYTMLEGIELIIGAFQQDDGSFELWTLNQEDFRSRMRATRSQGASAGKVGIVRKRTFTTHGKLLQRVSLNPQQ